MRGRQFGGEASRSGFLVRGLWGGAEEDPEGDGVGLGAFANDVEAEALVVADGAGNFGHDAEGAAFLIGGGDGVVEEVGADAGALVIGIDGEDGDVAPGGGLGGIEEFEAVAFIGIEAGDEVFPDGGGRLGVGWGGSAFGHVEESDGADRVAGLGLSDPDGAVLEAVAEVAGVELGGAAEALGGIGVVGGEDGVGEEGSADHLAHRT